jgi:hypothetical protein
MSEHRPELNDLPEDALDLAEDLSGVDVCEFIPDEALPYIDFCDVVV